MAAEVFPTLLVGVENNIVVKTWQHEVLGIAKAAPRLGVPWSFIKHPPLRSLPLPLARSPPFRTLVMYPLETVKTSQLGVHSFRLLDLKEL